MTSLVPSTPEPGITFRKIRGRRLYEGIVEQIFELIASGQLQPSHQLPPERQLADHLGVSRNVLREALRALELRGVVVSVHGGGRFIRSANVQDTVDTRGLILRLEQASVRDILESRALLEPQVARLAAERIDEPHAAELRQAADQHETWQDNVRFHVTLASATHNFILPMIVRIHLDLLTDLHQRRYYQTGQARALLLEHREIAEAVIAGDDSRALRLMTQHIENTRRLIGNVPDEEASS